MRPSKHANSLQKRIRETQLARAWLKHAKGKVESVQHQASMAERTRKDAERAVRSARSQIEDNARTPRICLNEALTRGTQTTSTTSQAGPWPECYD